MYVWAVVTSGAPLCLVWQPHKHHTAASKTQLDLPDTRNHYVVFVMEGAESEQKENSLLLLEEDFEVWSLVTDVSSGVDPEVCTSPFKLLPVPHVKD